MCTPLNSLTFCVFFLYVPHTILVYYFHIHFSYYFVFLILCPLLNPNSSFLALWKLSYMFHVVIISPAANYSPYDILIKKRREIRVTFIPSNEQRILSLNFSMARLWSESYWGATKWQINNVLRFYLKNKFNWEEDIWFSGRTHIDRQIFTVTVTMCYETVLRFFTIIRTILIYSVKII